MTCLNVFLCIMWMQCPLRPEEDVDPLHLAIQYGFWASLWVLLLNLVSLKEKMVHYAAEPSLQVPIIVDYFFLRWTLVFIILHLVFIRTSDHCSLTNLSCCHFENNKLSWTVYPKNTDHAWLSNMPFNQSCC